ncbi:MAG TPA: MBL fold metallo-hydrolase [Streptosporangiaceae bacterium]|jgi:ribonuclease BN (tRNA processing enzyme)
MTPTEPHDATLDVLGCSGGWSDAGRACSGYLLTANGGRVWIDAGTGTFERLLRRGPLADVDAVWLTHLHPDHCADLLMAFQAMAYGDVGTDRLPVYGPPGWAAVFDAFLGEEVAEVFEIHDLEDGAVHDLGGTPYTAVATHHGMPSFGLRADLGGRTFAYTSDTGPGPGTVRIADGADTLLAEAFLSLPGARAFTSVSTPKQAGAYAHEGGVRQLVLTHLHPDADPSAAVRRASTAFAGPISVATEGAVISL